MSRLGCCRGLSALLAGHRDLCLYPATLNVKVPRSTGVYSCGHLRRVSVRRFPFLSGESIFSLLGRWTYSKSHRCLVGAYATACPQLSITRDSLLFLVVLADVSSARVLCFFCLFCAGIFERRFSLIARYSWVGHHWFRIVVPLFAVILLDRGVAVSVCCVRDVIVLVRSFETMTVFSFVFRYISLCNIDCCSGKRKSL